MTSSYFRLIWLSLLIIVLQVWLFNPIALWRIATPIVYPLLLLFIPMSSGPIFMMLFGFIVGSLLDYLGFTPGLHATACTAVAFMRYYLLRAMLNEQDDPTLLPLPRAIRGRSYVLLITLLFANHLIIYWMSSSMDSDWLYILLRLGASLLLSVVLSLLLLVSVTLRLKDGEV